MELFGGIVPIGIPFSGFTPGCRAPLIVTLSGTNVVPVGIESVKIILIASTFPVFFTSEI